MRLRKTVARRVETRVKMLLSERVAPDAPQEFTHEVFSMPTRDDIKQVWEAIYLVEGEVARE
eukprot:5276290-Amphidinium_carterae.1